MSKLYEILIPKTANLGDVKAFNLEHDHRGDFTDAWHLEFETKIIGISGGMSKYPEIQGVWIEGGEMIAEKMIPYRIICTPQEMDRIAEFAKTHYKQKAIFTVELGTAKIYE